MGADKLSDVTVMQVSPMLIPAVRRSVEDLFAGKTVPGFVVFTLDGLLRRAMIGEVQLWIAYEDGEAPFLCMFTELINYQTMRVCHIHVIIGSHIRRVLDKWADFEAWALMQGAHGMDISVRPSMVKLLRKRCGFTPTGIGMHKSLIAIH